MRKTLYDVTVASLQAYPEDGRERDEWFFLTCAQPVLTVDQVQWTTNVTAAIGEISRGKNKRALDEFLEFSVE